ncbi:hypothetical protein [Actinosynnema sp. NPDC023587]|uniref:hypothetical protein n=1 Tax=Actinosynnema sp. NPDC023587 TaxID=3154695 RepID=UPI00340DCB5C
MTALTTRRPTGAAPWSRVLLSGEAGVDPGWVAAEFSGGHRLVTTYWLEVGTGRTGDMYAAVPGADYELLEHDGSWSEIYEQLCAAWELAREVAEDGGLSTGLVVNGTSGIWQMLCSFADTLSRRRAASALIRDGLDPAPAYSSEIKVEIDPDVWTLVGARHRQFMAKVLTWPGPVILTAWEDRTADGRWDLKAQPSLGWDVTAWVRFTQDERPEIVALNTAVHGRSTAAERAALREEFTLDRLVWTWSGCDLSTPMPVVRVLDADQVMPGEQPPVRAVRPARAPAPRTMRRSVPPPEPPPGDEAPPSDAEVTLHLVDAWTTHGDRAKTPTLWAHTKAAGESVLSTDVSGLLLEAERVLLDVAEGTPITVRELAERAARHLTKHGVAIRAESASAA